MRDFRFLPVVSLVGAVMLSGGVYALIPGCEDPCGPIRV